MTEFFTVLTAVDDVDEARHALRLASALVRLDGGDRLFAAHAVPELPESIEAVLFPYACFGDDRDALRAELAKNAAQRLGRALGKHLPGNGAEALRVEQGDPIDALLRLSGTLGPDIVVVGPGGHGGADARHIGRVPSALARRLTCDLAFARPSADEELQVRRVVAAIDLSDDAVHVLSRAVVLAHRLGAKVQPVFVLPTQEADDHADLVPNADRGLGGKVRKSVSARWNQIESQLDLPFPVEAGNEPVWRKQIATSGDPGPKIVEIAEESKADLVVVGRCRAGGSSQRLGRVAEYVVRHAPCHVLVVDAPQTPDAAA